MHTHVLYLWLKTPRLLTQHTVQKKNKNMIKQTLQPMLGFLFLPRHPRYSTYVHKTPLILVSILYLPGTHYASSLKKTTMHPSATAHFTYCRPANQAYL